MAEALKEALTTRFLNGDGPMASGHPDVQAALGSLRVSTVQNVVQDALNQFAKVERDVERCESNAIISMICFSFVAGTRPN